MRYTLLLLLLIGVTTKAFSQCSYKSKLMNYTITAPKGWDLLVNDKPRCTGIDTFSPTDDVKLIGNSQQEQIICRRGDNATITFLMVRTPIVDESFKKDLHKMVRYNYRTHVYPHMRSLGLKPRNSKTYTDTLGNRTFSVTRTEGKVGKKVFLTTYLYTWTEEHEHMVVVVIPENPSMEKELLTILTNTLAP